MTAKYSHHGVPLKLLRGYVSKSSAALNPLTVTQLACEQPWSMLPYRHSIVIHGFLLQTLYIHVYCTLPLGNSSLYTIALHLLAEGFALYLCHCATKGMHLWQLILCFCVYIIVIVARRVGVSKAPPVP